MAVEEVRHAPAASSLGFLDQGNEKCLNGIDRTVIGVEYHIDVISIGDAVDALGEGDGPERAVLDRRTGGECSASCRNLDNPVASRFCESSEDSARS